jgi:RNA polymerase sigma-70 factor (ECF subfamily)
MFFIKKLSTFTDEMLMQQVYQGDKASLEEIYQRYSRSLIRYFYRMLWKDEEKAQDFLHDLFVKIIERPQRFDVEQKFSTWIYSVANNMCKNEYRKQSFRKVVNGTSNVLTSYSDPIHQKLDNAAFRQELDHAIATLPEDDKTIFILRYEMEMGLKEIGAIMGCPEGTIKSRLFYLKKRLSEQFHYYKITLQ